MRVDQLTGPLLALWVARAIGYAVFGSDAEAIADDDLRLEYDVYTTQGKRTAVSTGQCDGGIPWRPHKDWSQGGPLLDQLHISLRHYDRSMYNYRHTADGWMHGPHWSAFIDNHPKAHYAYPDQQPLVAAMRVVVASVYGAEVPDSPHQETP